MAAAKIKFYQSPRDRVDRFYAVEDEIIVDGGLTLSINRFTRPASAFLNIKESRDEFVSIRVEAFTDVMNTWRRLDKMRIFHKIERAELRGTDDLARLLVACGLKHVPHPGAPYAPDGGAGEARRIKELHS